MADTLFKAVDVSFTSESSQYDTTYKRTAKWDPETGDFVRDGSHKVVECDGREGFAIWCFKVAQTERYRCLAYPSSIGVEMETALDMDDHGTTQSMVMRTITDALMVNPRTEDVYGFEFDWDGDEMHCSFKVKGIGEDEEYELSI